MKWNLVDHASVAAQDDPITKSGRRAFYLPLASIPPGKKEVQRQADKNQFEPVDDVPLPSNDPVFRISITAPSGGFRPDGDLPDPAIRLHAMAAGDLRYKPALKQLILTIYPITWETFVLPLWWGQWTLAGVECYPHQVIYENVDENQLHTWLNNLKPDKPDQSFYGLSFPKPAPVGPNIPIDASFIPNFLRGEAPYFLVAASGAVIGTADTSPPGNSDPAAPRLVRLRARYYHNTDPGRRPMNPRELLYLLFGDDSDETQNHPLLQRMDEIGRNDNTRIESKTIRLRPPLRTWKRVIWEADFELLNSYRHLWGVWELRKPDGTLVRAAKCNPPNDDCGRCTTRVYNTYRSGNGNALSYGAERIRPYNHCNIFISDVALRAGFRILIQTIGAAWHYVEAGGYGRRVHAARADTDRVPLRGRSAGIDIPWGWKIDGWLGGIHHSLREAALNDAMQEEGRCLILVGERSDEQGKDPDVGHSNTHIGHILILENVNAEPTFLHPRRVRDGLQTIRFISREAQGVGARTRAGVFSLAPRGQIVKVAADATGGFSTLHIFELHPGQDPDTLVGLENCNVVV